MKIGNHVEALELSMNFSGTPSIIYPTAIWNDEGVTLFDTGVPGQLEAFKDALSKIGKSLSDVKQIVLTHQDIDHIGSLTELLKASEGKVQVYAHAEDIPYIEGDKPLIKYDPVRFESMFASLPEEVGAKMKAQFSQLQVNKVDHALADGEELSFLPGVKVVFTPGHTPGHISLYVESEKLLIAGDALVVDENGQLQGPREAVTPDMESAMQSVEKLTHLDIDKVLCYHGGLYTNNPVARLKEIVQSK
ncbi:MBL fold metallo-hydrolase [Pullulanibacillus sp. KACC 23026]|uniref:MBL fold metallo-hydrolase n=1 Tax=Pullulanibacillus sp. KACC 23026 TaxID=3028315 RepID=UPI0023B10092|nr:MBL fold metallo-hydrolase [Pullulanibacillus sp. KACC 23026]WEG13015.1 MBL fold metallo-hydrolase [Pullulanibacillus sp. KACC 23026]